MLTWHQTLVFTNDPMFYVIHIFQKQYTGWHYSIRYYINSSNIDNSLSWGTKSFSICQKTSDRCHVSIFCLVYSISRHGLFKNISPILFSNGKLRKTADNPPNKDTTPFANNFYRQVVFTQFFWTLGRLMNLESVLRWFWYVSAWINSLNSLQEQKNWNIITSFDYVSTMSRFNGFRLDPA